MPIGKFSEIILPVSDLDAAIDQYEALGFQLIGPMAWGGALLQRGAIKIALTTAELFTRPCVSFEVSGIFRTVEELRKAGLQPQGEITTIANGDRCIHLLDSSGNDIFLWQNARLVEGGNE